MATNYGSFPEPRRVEILQSGGSTYFKPGQMAYALSWDERGGCFALDRKGPSRSGERVFLVSKTKGMRGGGLWFSAAGIRFTKPASGKTQPHTVSTPQRRSSEQSAFVAKVGKRIDDAYSAAAERDRARKRNR